MRLGPDQTKPAPRCIHCQRGMHAEKFTQKSTGLQLAGVLTFLFGLALLAAFPLGTLAGIVLITLSLRLGYQKKDGWRCPNCRYSYTID